MQVFTDFPLKKVLQKLDASGRLMKWAIELNEFDVIFKWSTSVKGQALADFMIEFIPVLEIEKEMEPT